MFWNKNSIYIGGIIMAWSTTIFFIKNATPKRLGFRLGDFCEDVSSHHDELFFPKRLSPGR